MYQSNATWLLNNNKNNIFICEQVMFSGLK